jgi:glycosyltransferase involved in cell wall biosynthesis
MPLLIQPAAGGRLSGGYLYNQRMAEHGAWQLQDVTGDALSHTLSALPVAKPGALLLADSIWLTEQHVPAFLGARSKGWQLGVVLHSFPSLIAQTEAGLAPSPQPTAAELEALALFDWVVLVGPHYRAWLEPLGIRTLLCSPGVADTFRAPPRDRVGPCRLVSLATQSPRKGLLDAAQALAQLSPGCDYTWTVAGSAAVDPGYAEQLRHATRELNVHLLGQQPPDVTAKLLVQADVLLMPSYDENHPLVLLEAMAASVPSIAYAAGAAHTLLEPPERGLVVPIGDVTGFAACLRRLLTDEELRRSMAQACFEWQQRQLPTWAVAGQQARDALAAAVS